MAKRNKSKRGGYWGARKRISTSGQSTTQEDSSLEGNISQAQKDSSLEGNVFQGDLDKDPTIMIQELMEEVEEQGLQKNGFVDPYDNDDPIFYNAMKSFNNVDVENYFSLMKMENSNHIRKVTESACPKLETLDQDIRIMISVVKQKIKELEQTALDLLNLASIGHPLVVSEEVTTFFQSLPCNMPMDQMYFFHINIMKNFLKRVLRKLKSNLSAFRGKLLNFKKISLDGHVHEPRRNWRKEGILLIVRFAYTFYFCKDCGAPCFCHFYSGQEFLLFEQRLNYTELLLTEILMLKARNS